MATIILDISANTHRNDAEYYQKMINELKEVDRGKHEIILKWQLFEKQGENKVADKKMFIKMKEWAWNTHRYQTTASVFDIHSVKFLCEFDDIPFVKIANNHELHYLAGYVPRRIPIYMSVSHGAKNTLFNNTTFLYCVSKYPADIEDYPRDRREVSDHTVGLELFKRNGCMIWEKHFKLSDSTGLDAGSFAITPNELKEIL
jgi:sialic acid synthase SpsE